MESLTLATPEVIPQITNGSYRVGRIDLDWDQATITIVLVGANGERRSFDYTGATATTLMVGLNKANLSIQSLQARVLARLVADGKLAGVVSGTPD